ncbi:MAG: permease-like cell division protein FtsX [Clostridia bacterium]|nr:permease-like cell division protein FtsX [Clostridia bacterium]
MKIRTTKYIIKEGFINAYRNKLMSLASISIVAASLVIFGMFLLITINLGQNLKGLEEQPELEVFCDHELDDAQVQTVEQAIKDNTKIQGYTKVTRQDAFDKVKKMLENNASVLEGMDESFLPVSFKIKLNKPQESKQAVEELRSIKGVEKVTYPQQVIETISKLSYWLRLISVIVIAILLIVAMFIISNTIKLTVFARRKEINIMKYIGATDWFIRWPFVIEGIIIGFLGAVVAFVVISYGYSAIGDKVNSDLIYSGISFIKFVKMREIGFEIISLYAIIGSSVGAIGSVMSIRKYLHV